MGVVAPIRAGCEAAAEAKAGVPGRASFTLASGSIASMPTLLLASASARTLRSCPRAGCGMLALALLAAPRRASAPRLVECAKADGNTQIYPFIVIWLETAMRRREILAIRREDIDLQRRVVFILKANAGAREQPITEHLADFLSSYAAALQPGNPWLFPSPGVKAGHTVHVRKPFRRVVTAAGLDPDQILRHTLRHTAITHLVQAGVDLPTVKRISGHKTLAMVERYSHQNGSHIQSAMDELQARLKLA